MAEHAVKKVRESTEKREERQREGQEARARSNPRGHRCCLFTGAAEQRSKGAKEPGSDWELLRVYDPAEMLTQRFGASSLGLPHLPAPPIRSVNRAVTSETRLME